MSTQEAKSKVVTLPIGKTCPRASYRCKVAKAHARLNDAIEYLQEAVNEMHPTEALEVEGKEILVEILAGLQKLEEGSGSMLIYYATDCGSMLKCRC